MENQIKHIIKVIVILILLQIPFLFVSVIGHELIHKYDYRNIEKVNESFCFIDCGEGLAHYSFVPTTQEQTDKALIIQQITEIHAWWFTITIMSIYVMFVVYILIKQMKGGIKENGKV